MSLEAIRKRLAALVLAEAGSRVDSTPPNMVYVNRCVSEIARHGPTDLELMANVVEAADLLRWAMPYELVEARERYDSARKALEASQ